MLFRAFLHKFYWDVTKKSFTQYFCTFRHLLLLSVKFVLVLAFTAMCCCTWKFIIKSPLLAGEKAYAVRLFLSNFWLLIYYITLFLFIFQSGICYFSTHYVSVFNSIEICCYFLLICFVVLLENGCLSFCHEVFGNQIQVVCQINL